MSVKYWKLLFVTTLISIVKVIIFCMKHSMALEISSRVTVTDLTEMLNDITKLFDNKNNIDLVTIDFSKAFDTISHA